MEPPREDKLNFYMSTDPILRYIYIQPLFITPPGRDIPLIGRTGDDPLSWVRTVASAIIAVQIRQHLSTKSDGSSDGSRGRRRAGRRRSA